MDNVLHILNYNTGLERLRKRKDNIYQFLDYYPKKFKECGLSRDRMSNEMFLEIKEKNDNTFYCELFMEMLLLWELPPQKTGVFIVPSSTKGVWNYKLYECMDKCLWHIFDSRMLISSARNLYRHKEHEKLSYGGGRNIESHLNTIELWNSIPESMEYAIIIDDITTTGNTFKACTKILNDSGIPRKNIFCAAIGGTVSKQ